MFYKVLYPSGVKADLGNELTPTQVKDQPSVGWDADPNSFYTLCLTGTYIRETVSHYKNVKNKYSETSPNGRL